MLTPLLTESMCARWHHLVDRANRIMLCAHVGPDGDAVGACLGMMDFLKQQGKQVQIVVPNDFPDFLKWLPGASQMLVYESNCSQKALQVAETADLIVCMDFNELERLGALKDVVAVSPKPKIMIDHHLNPTGFADLEVSRPKMSSTCEIVFRLIWELGGFSQMTEAGATAIYCGMMTDTGGFTYNSSDSDIYFIISQLLTKRIDKDRIYRNVYHNYSQDRIRLMGYILYEKLRFFKDCRASLYTLTDADMKKFNYIKGDSEGFVNLPLTVKGLILSIALREDTEKNVIRVSLRSVDDFPCNKMASDFFYGGGHLNAAGGELNCSMDDAVRVVEQAVGAYRALLQ